MDKLLLEVSVFNTESEYAEQHRVVDHMNKRDRRWISNVIFWAVRNGKGVEIAPK